MYFVEDEKFAHNLQRKFNSFGIESPTGKYDKENVIDSKLEYHDPTPSIHELFRKFNKRFFWGMLGMVEVMWSNRMTSCAGLCSYQGRSGYCSIKLSAPLLSLRPRKNLVETLLHEMIHAYLFVTKNYKDRDDHGPEFHKHMLRINKEAGTNITVYHDYLDEVAYYQKHIWRCNGPCQNRRPYFGFVKRAMNRAPGPADKWWSEHQQSCGGTYIKVSEPEKTTQKKSRKNIDKDQKNKLKIPVKTKDIRNFFINGCSQETPAHLTDLTKKGSNIYTFKDLDGTPKPKVSVTSVRTFNETNVLGSQTGNKTGVGSESGIKEIHLGENKDEVRAKVRNIWANKYPLTSNKLKAPARESLTNEAKKRRVECPICNLPFNESVINEHVNECLPDNDSIEILDEIQPTNSVLEKKTKPCDQASVQVIDIEEEENDKKQRNSLSECPVCSLALQEEELQDHLESCLGSLFEHEEFTKQEDDCENVPCPCCMKWVPEKNINNHIDECLTMRALKNCEN